MALKQLGVFILFSYCNALTILKCRNVHFLCSLIIFSAFQTEFLTHNVNRFSQPRVLHIKRKDAKMEQLLYIDLQPRYTGYTLLVA